jgi:hypothetical protein
MTDSRLQEFARLRCRSTASVHRGGTDRDSWDVPQSAEWRCISRPGAQCRGSRAAGVSDTEPQAHVTGHAQGSRRENARLLGYEAC